MYQINEFTPGSVVSIMADLLEYVDIEQITVSRLWQCYISIGNASRSTVGVSTRTALGRSIMHVLQNTCVVKIKGNFLKKYFQCLSSVSLTFATQRSFRVCDLVANLISFTSKMLKKWSVYWKMCENTFLAWTRQISSRDKQVCEKFLMCSTIS